MRSRLFLLALTSTLVGCEALTGPARASLTGTWAEVPMRFSFDSAAYDTALELNTDGTFRHVARATEPSGTPRFSTSTEGTFTVRGDSIFINATMMRSWDRRFNDGAVIATPIAGDPLYGGGARISFRSDSLVLRYVGFHPDLWVESVEVFGRTYTDIRAKP